MRNFYKIFFIIILFSIVFTITGCSDKEELTVENKIQAEKEFVKSGVEIFLKKCEDNEYLKEGNIDWDNISQENLTFINSFPTIEADLAYVKLDNNQINNIKNIIQNINTNIQNKDLDKVREQYSNLYIAIENLSSDSFKNIRILAMQIYMNSIVQNNTNLNELIQNIENEYKKVDLNKTTYIELNRIEEIINNMRNLLNEKRYKDLEMYSLRIIEIL